MNIDLADQYSSGYCLSLGGGNKWWITGDEDSLPLVDELAAIMELKECKSNSLARLIFSKMMDENGVRNGTSDTAPAIWRQRDHGNTKWICYDERIIRIWHHDSIPDVICEIGEYERDDVKYVIMWSALRPIYQRSISEGGLPFHAGLAELEGRGVLLAAPGDTGKSTCCRRLPDYWKPLGDDEALTALNKQKEYRAHPFPTWSDYLWEREKNTWNVQYSVTLSGIFFLEQSETDGVVPLGAGEAAVLISESAAQVCRKFWRRADIEYQRKFRREIFGNACEIAERIPAFRLGVSLHGRFWEEIENVLT